MKKFSIFDHEADIGVEIYGDSMEELFRNAAHALFSLMVEEKENIKGGENLERQIEVKKNGELLISFLNELLFLWETQRMVLKDLLLEMESEGLKATLLGKKFDPEIHLVKKEIKAATYHNFEIKKTENGYVAKVVFDV